MPSAKAYAWAPVEGNGSGNRPEQPWATHPLIMVLTLPSCFLACSAGNSFQYFNYKNAPSLFNAQEKCSKLG